MVKNLLLLLFCIGVVAIAVFSFTDRGKTLILVVAQGATAEWKGYSLALNYSYLAVPLNDELVVYKVNPGFNGMDMNNTLHLDSNATQIKELTTAGCANVPELCEIKKEDGYTSISVNSSQYEVFHLSDHCDVVIFFRGNNLQYEKYIDFVRNFFDQSCK